MTNALQQILAEIRNALLPFEDAGDPFVRDAILDAFQLPPETAAALPSIDFQPIEAFLSNPAPQLNDFLNVTDAVITIVSSLRTFVTTAFISPPLDAQAAMKAGLDALAIGWLQRRQRIVYCLARALGIIETELTAPKREELFLKRIIPLITDSKVYFETRYPLQTELDAKAASDAIFAPLAELADLLATQLTRHTNTHIRALYGRDAPPIGGAPVANAIFERTLVFPVTAHDESTGADATILLTAILVPTLHGGPGLSLRFAGATFEAPLGDDWIFKASMGSASSLSLWWIKGQGIRIDAPAQTAVQVEIALAPDPDRTPLALSITENTRFEIGDVNLKLSANVNEIDARVTIHNAALIVGKETSDSFSGSKLPSAGARGAFDLEIGLSSVRGFYIGGTAGLTAIIPLHSDIGPLLLDTLTIDVRTDSAPSAIRAKAGLALSLKVGPVTAVVDGIGMRLNVSFPETGANLGIVDFAPAFQPPSGLGIVIKAGPVTGGGYIYYDEAAGRYSGVLQLEMRGIAIKAVGILDTKLPGGGYSFLIIMSGEFSPIQLGMGFTLNGVGGLAGINRTVSIAAMQAGIRNHAADAVLFPKDPVKNAPRIISDLQRYFPPLKEHYIFGPAALIGWGSPTPLLTVKLGIILEFPPPLRIVLLGQLDCKLPDATAIVDLHVDILGVIDFGAKTFALDGVIHDSRVGPYALYGDFAVRLRWGSDPTFALSIGGFNPHFHQIPAGFPTLRRITIALSDGSNPRLTLQCYLALTSNSLQLGARAELYAEADGFSVSGWIGFDALVYFHPFGFRVDLSAGFLLRRGSKSLGGIQVEATLTGPSPWHVWGDASISILWFDVSVSFDVTIGSSGPGALPSTNIWLALQGALETKENWSAVLPPAAAQVVTLRQPFDPTLAVQGASSAPPLYIDPVGTITLVERVAPLDRTITRFADAAPGGPFHRFDLSAVTINKNAINGWTLTQELFAPAQFEQLSDDEKLSRPSFERMAAGMSLPQLVTLGGFVASNVTFRTVVFDSPVESHDGVAYAMDAALQVALADVGSAATGGMLASTQPYVAAGTKPKVTLDEEAYVIVLAADLTRRLVPPGPKGAVIAALNDHLASHPADRANLIVVPEYEAAA